MKAKDIMTPRVVTADADLTVREIASLLVERGISAVPILDEGTFVGIISEGDLIHRRELGSDAYRRRGSWYHLLDDDISVDAFRAKSNGLRARDVMTRDVVTISEHLSLREVAEIMEINNVKQLPVTRDDDLVGIVTRVDIIRALAARPEGATAPVASDDDEIRVRVLELLEELPGTSPWLTTVLVTDGVVTLFGTVEDPDDREPSRAAIEELAHVVRVEDHRSVLQPY